MKRSTTRVLSPVAFAALLSAALLTAGALCSSAAPRAQAADEPATDPSLGVTVSGPIISETPVAPSFDTVGEAETDALPNAEPSVIEATPSPDATPEESNAPSPETAPEATAGLGSTEATATDEVSYPGGVMGFDADGIPVGPDMTRAEESGLPMAGGVSANPAETLLEEAERRFEDGSSPEVIAVDNATGRLEYGA